MAKKEKEILRCGQTHGTQECVLAKGHEGDHVFRNVPVVKGKHRVADFCHSCGAPIDKRKPVKRQPCYRDPESPCEPNTHPAGYCDGCGG
jgi:hypothetical protein